MAKVNTVIEGNILKIDTTSSNIQYWNAPWISLSFDAENVYLSNNGAFVESNPIRIALADFQYDSADYNTEAAVATILSDKIG